MKAEAAIAAGHEWHEVLEELKGGLPMLAAGAPIDLALLFASDVFAREYADILTEVRRLTGARVLIGCSGQGIIGPGREIEGEPAISLQVFSLPGAVLSPVRLKPADVARGDADSVTSQLVSEMRPEDAKAWMFFADPFSLDGENLLELLDKASPGAPLIGGLASGSYSRQETYVFLDDQAFDGGAVGVAIGGAYTVKTVVSQGAAPIGEPWTITGAHENVIESIGMRPAFDVLSDTFRALSPEMQTRAQRNLLVGLAMNEYKDEFHRGDFLIRNLVGINQATGEIGIGAYPRVGQTIQFQLRDPDAADEDLKALLARARDEMEGQQAVGALLCSCNGRGIGLFGTPDHDARTLTETLGQIPVAGFFCNGEIGPVGNKNFLHGFTASIALIVPADS